MSETGAMTAVERGNAMHICMQRLDIARLRGLGPNEMEIEIEAQLDNMTGYGMLTPAARGAISANAVARFFLSDLGQRALRAGDLRREWTFILKKSAREATGADSDERMLVQGAIDMCFVEEGSWVLVDYKTDSRLSAETIKERYKPQLDLYAEALSRLTGREVSAMYICFLRGGEVIEV
jgi:ATP-dependent helicase/nuclease subunit A